MSNQIMVDGIINKLLQLRGNKKSIQLTEIEIRKLCMLSLEIFMKQPMLLEIQPPINVCGDIHGQYFDLLRIFDKIGYPPRTQFLFLGDYVDRGKHSIETICLLLAFKVKYPTEFYLLRGNHESATANRMYGFYDECEAKYNVQIWSAFVNCFNCLPVAAIIGHKIFCVHGGLSPEMHSLEDIKKLKRPSELPDHGLFCDLVWSDPSCTEKGWGLNSRGVSFTYGESVVKEFLRKFGFDLIIRAHELVEDGYKFFAEKKLVTVFSAPNYCGDFDNAGAVVSVDSDLICSFIVIPPDFKTGKPESGVFM